MQPQILNMVKESFNALSERRCSTKSRFGFRVPTSSNLADKPSRLETSELDALGVERTAVNWQEVETQLAAETGSDEWGFKNGILAHSPALL